MSYRQIWTLAVLLVWVWFVAFLYSNDHHCCHETEWARLRHAVVMSIGGT